MSIVEVKNVTFAYPNTFDYVFKGLSFNFDVSWKLGLVGRNGCGKTTLMRLLKDEFNYRGEISTSVDFEYFPFKVKCTHYLVIDAILSLYPLLEIWRFKREMSLLGLDINLLYQVYDTLSQGEQTKIMLAVLFSKEHAFLLIDEPTNHLDAKGRASVAHYLNSKSGFMLISHDRVFLDHCIDHILVINKVGITLQKGNFSTWYQNKRYEDQFEIEQHKKTKKEIHRLKHTIQRTATWSDKVERTKIGGESCDRGFVGAQAARVMKRAKAIEKRYTRALEEKSHLLKNIETPYPLKVQSKPYIKEVYLHLEKVQIKYDTVINKPIDIILKKGERLAITGQNGTGKSSILKVILGENIKCLGKCNIGSQLKISYVSQDTRNLKGSLRTFCKGNSIDEGMFKTILHKLNFKTLQFDKLIEQFSEGQKKKVAIAKSLCEHAHLYIWDEPLNYIDVISRIQIEDAILKYHPTMIVIEHDTSFINKIATKCVEVLKA